MTVCQSTMPASPPAHALRPASPCAPAAATVLSKQAGAAAGVHSATRYSSSAVLPVLRRIAADEGPKALWRGLQPRVLFHIPAAAVCWGSYESMKRLLRAELEQ